MRRVDKKMDVSSRATASALLDVLSQSSGTLDQSWHQLEVAHSHEGEAHALATWLLVVDHVLTSDQVCLALPKGWLDLTVDRKLSIEAWTDVVRGAMANAVPGGPSDVEFAWSDARDGEAKIVLRPGLAANGKCTIRFNTPPIGHEGVDVLASLWSCALKANKKVLIADIAWGEAVAPSIVRNELRPSVRSLDVPSNFKDVVQRYPDSIAVVEKDREWTYREIDALADSIAQALLKRDIERGDIVAVGLPRSAIAIATLLGVLRIGAAYLPLDLDYPVERLSYMIEDAGVQVLVADLSEGNPCSGLELTFLDVSQLQHERPHKLPEVGGESLAYVMYTSGSTGQPKGVEVRHQGICRLVLNSGFMQLDETTAMLHAAPLGFDASTLEIWGPLLNGGRCIVHDEVVPTGGGLADTINGKGVSSAWLTAALFNSIVDDSPHHLEGLATLLIGGEALSVKHVKMFLNAASSTKLINGYGPTETTTFATTHPIELNDIADAVSVPIGRPINATALYILNEHGDPLPRGLIGELYIGGLGVARGYLQRPELTDERFVLDPFAADGSLMYRTGDHVRLTSNDVVEFVGRVDGQVKIRGFRIETAEIELVLSKHADVRSCAVVAHDDPARGAELVAYVVPPSNDYSPNNLRKHLAQSLPDYMVPTQWVRLESLPVTANGKLDRRKLPAPQRKRPDDSLNPFVEPAPGAEYDVAKAMTKVLGLDRVGALDNFFELGGNSLLVTRAHAEIQNAGYTGLLVAHFFADPTPRAIARRLSSSTQASKSAPVKKDTNEEPIAIIGMAGRFPGAPDIESFWQMLCEGRDAITFFNQDELDASIPNELRQDSRYVSARGVIDDVDMFDASFFGMSPREAELMDPQQRIFLELAWECLERAGQVPEKTPDPIGVFSGMYNSSYFAHHVQSHPEKVARFGEFLVMLANEKDYIATRTAHKLGLTGPAVSVLTACSTSLVAIAQAFDALRSGQCGLALAGGASVTCPPASGYLYQEGAMLSPDGHTRTFDVDAQGTVFSDGAAVVLLKRLSDAIKDGNTVYAVVRGVSVNNDGAGKASYTAPSIEGQATVVRSALARANVDARSIDYVEAHGTATPLGDPVEVAALTEVFKEQTQDTGFCSIGSLKSNTGHMVIAAGAGGVIKTALSLYHEKLPATLHYTKPNPKIDFENSPFVVAGEIRDWPRKSVPRRAGVSSFGVGGTNAHAILEEAPSPKPSTCDERLPQLLPLSARDPKALISMYGRLADHLERNPEISLADVAYTLSVGRRDFSQRAVIVAETVPEAIAVLRDRSSSEDSGVKLPSKESAPVMMFPGQGAQYAGMGRDIYARDAGFRRDLDACFDAFGAVLDFDLRERMFSDNPDDCSQTETTQPATFALEYALANVWLSRGVTPTALLGHSVGEFAAATIAGVMRVEDAAHLVARRAALMQALPPGAMLGVRMGVDELTLLLPDGVQLAAENGPTACVVSGPEQDVSAFAEQLDARGVASRRLNTSHAFHSAMMDPAVPKLEAAVRDVELAAPKLSIVSTVTGKWMTAEEAQDPGYWACHMRNPVRFSAAFCHLLGELDAGLFLEVGPGSTLSSLARQHRKDKAKPHAVASLSNDSTRELKVLTEAAGRLWVSGVNYTWSPQSSQGRQRIVLPTYPYNRKRHWLEAGAHKKVANENIQSATPPQNVAAKTVPMPPVTQASNSTSQPQQTATASSQTTREKSTTPMTDRHFQLIQRLCVLFEDVTGVELEESDASENFLELGLDSLTLTQVALQLKNEFSLPITFRQLMENHQSLDALAKHIASQLPEEETEIADVADDAEAPVSANVEGTQPPAPVAAGTQVSVQLMPAHSMPIPAAANGQSSFVQEVIQQQMALMTQQLALLQGQGQGQVAMVPPATVPTNTTPVTPAATEAPEPRQETKPVTSKKDIAGKNSADQDTASEHKTYDVKKAFGAIARIHSSVDGLAERQRTRLGAFIERYTEKTKRSKDYTTEHRPHLADPRVVNGFRPQLKEIIYQIVIERSKGPHVWDIDGNQYVDALNGFGMNLFGWQPDFVIDAVREQLDRGYEIGPQHPLAGTIAKQICELTGFDRAGLCNTGSEAVMGCVRIARTVTGRKKIVMFNGAYHGIFDEVIVRGTKKGKAVPAAPGIMKNTAENVVVLEYGTPETLQWLRDNASVLAAVLVEPVQSRKPEFQPREFLRNLRDVTSEAGTLLIFDEVVTGFRSHPGGAQAVFNIRADLASYGKVVGGGYPIGVIAGKREFMDALDGGHWQFGDDSVPTVGVTYFAGTFVRHPLALAAAHAVLEHIKSEGSTLQEGLNDRTGALVDDLNSFCKEVGAPIKINNFSSVWKITFEEDHPFQDLLFAMMRNRGVHILDNFPCFMTTAHDSEAIATIKTAFKEAVAELQQSDFLPRRVEAKVLAFDSSRPPVPNARLGRDADGKPAWFIVNPDAPGKFIKVDAK